MVAAGTRKVEEVIDSRQLENVIDNITKQVVHTTQVTAQDCQYNNAVPTWPFLRLSTGVAVSMT